jgi:hypothetical protein
MKTLKEFWVDVTPIGESIHAASSKKPDITEGTVHVIEAAPEVISARDLMVCCEAALAYLLLEPHLDKEQLVNELSRVVRVVKGFEPRPHDPKV